MAIMINQKLKAEADESGLIRLCDARGEAVAVFNHPAYFYVVTGFKSAKEYNDHHENQPTKFLVVERQH